MLRRYNRLLVAFYVVSDAVLGVVAFGLAYFVRFSSGLIPVVKGYPPFEQYVAGAAVHRACWSRWRYQFQGLYRLRRGRSRVDDFFTVFIGSSRRGGARHRHARCTSRPTTLSRN